MQSEQRTKRDTGDKSKNQTAVVGRKEGKLSMFAQAICAKNYSLSNPLTFVFFNTVSFVQLEQGASAFLLLCSIPKSFGELVCFQGLCRLSVKSALQHFMHTYSPRAVFLVEEVNHVSK